MTPLPHIRFTEGLNPCYFELGHKAVMSSSVDFDFESAFEGGSSLRVRGVLKTQYVL